MRRIKKITAVCLLLLMLLSMTACGKAGDQPDQPAFAAVPPTAEQLTAAQKAEQTPMRPKSWHYAVGHSGYEQWCDYFYDEQGRLIRSEQYQKHGGFMNDIDMKTCTYQYSPQEDGVTKVYLSSGSGSITLNAEGKCMERIFYRDESDQYRYDAQGRVIRISGKDVWEEVTDFQWDEHNRLSSWAYSSYRQYTKKWTHNANGDVVRMDFCEKTSGLADKTYTMEYEWAYENDESGRLTAKNVRYGKVGETERHTTEAIRYLYDETGILTGAVTEHSDVLMGAYPYGLSAYNYAGLIFNDWSIGGIKIVWEVVPA